MSKISELSDGGSLVSTDYLIAVRSGGNVKVRMDEINVDQVDLGDNEFIRLGNSQDLTLVHNASNSIINQAGIGDLLIQKAGSTKLTVNSTGIDVTGVITTDGLTSVGGFISIGADGAGDDFRFYGDTSGRYMEWVSAADSLLFRDGAKALFGNGSDLQIYHDGSHSYVSDQGTGNLRIYANDLVLANNDGSETFLYGVNGGGVSISYANSAKVTTTATGIDVTGTVTADGLTVETAAGTSGTIALLRNSSSASNGNAAYLDFKFDNSFSGSNVDVQIGAIKTNAGNEESAFVVKTTEGAGTPTERMRIDASGNLMVGTPTSAGRFSVEHSSTSTPAGFFNNPNAGTSGVQAIGTSLPSTANNTNCYHLKSTTQGVASYFLYGDGSSSFTSDERQKKNIVTTRDGYLEDLKNLRVVDFHWNNQEDTEDKSIGLIAQEVEQVFPRLIVEHELEGAGVRKNLKGSDFTFILIKALQEAMDRIETLEAKVAALES